jgi:endonuclease-3 related protein
VEALVGAILGKGTDRRRIDRLISDLREAGVLDVGRLSSLPAEELAEFFRSVDKQGAKARRLRGVLRLAEERYGGDLEAMFATHPDSLRDELLATSGIGPETADTILLEAAGVPKFAVDTHAHRVAARHGWVEFQTDYETVREYFESGLEPEAERYNAFRGLLVRVGKEHCRTKPICEGCPLAELLPVDRSGVRRPLEPESFD